MTVQLQKATQHCYYRAVLAIYLLAPDQTIAQMWSNDNVSQVTVANFLASQVTLWPSEVWCAALRW